MTIKENHGFKYNSNRLVRKLGIAALGFSVGTAAAAVQAGISITDGKYNPMEGMATFTAGYAGGGQIAKVIGSLGNTYTEGALEGNGEAQMERVKDKYADRDDVITFNKKNYAGKEKEMTERQRDNWLQYGYYNPKDMKSGIKYADKYLKDKYGDNFNNLSEEEKKKLTKQADKRAVQAMWFEKRLRDQGQLKAIRDKDLRNKYIESMIEYEAGPNATDADKARIRRTYENAFKAVLEYQESM